MRPDCPIGRSRTPRASGIDVAVAGAAGRRRARIVAAVRSALRSRGCAAASISVAVVDDAEIAELHERYMAIAGPTDVLSFDLSDELSGGRLEGQVVVSVDTARREARARKLPPEQELLRYVIHGTLHLLGYDDDTAARARRMHRAEDELLGLVPSKGRRANG
jgi:rRNA maturation RNase YbeY